MKIIATLYRLLGFKTFKELNHEMNQGKRKSINAKEMARARKLELALMPSNITYPSGGEKYESIKDVEITYLTHWRAPFTGGGKFILIKGQVVIVETPNHEKPISVYCEALNKGEIEKKVITDEQLNNPKYAGYSLSIDTISLNNNFKKNT